MGAYGVVCSGKNNLTNQFVAIKKVFWKIFFLPLKNDYFIKKKKKKIKNAFLDLIDAKRILREIKLLSFFFFFFFLFYIE